MRVLQLIPNLLVGGAERVVASLAIGLRRAGYDVGVVSLFPAGGSWIEQELRGAGVPVRFLGKRPGPDPRMVPRIARAIGEFRPDVVHTHLNVLKYALPTIAARRPGVVHTVHSLAEREVERTSQVLHFFAFRAGIVPIAIGTSVADSVRRLYRLDGCRIIPNGISVADCEATAGARDAVREALGIAPDAPLFVFVGRLDPAKDPATLVRAFASSRLRAEGARLVVVGDGELRPECERLAADLGAADRVRFLGIRSDVPRVLAAADAFVLASLWEGNPLSVMEAMASGKAIVATSVGCVPELVPEEAGRLVPPGDPAALEAALLEVARDPPLARARGAAAARWARAHFDASLMTRAYEEVYAEVA